MFLNRNLFKATPNRMQNMPMAGMPSGVYGMSQIPYKGGFAVGSVKYGQPVVYPTQMNTVNTYETTVVPVIHPQHTQVIHNQLVQMQHYYPNTISSETKTACVNQNCGCR